MLKLYSLFIILLAITIITPGCSSSSPNVVRVGEVTFNQKEIELKAAIQYLEQNYLQKNQNQRDLKKEVSNAMKQLVSAYVNAEILKKYGRTITDKMVEDEALRIDKTTQLPIKLQQIKSAYQDRSQYLKLYVFPILADRMIYFDLFLQYLPIHQEVISKLEKFKHSLKNKKSFEIESKKDGLIYSRAEVDANGFLIESSSFVSGVKKQQEKTNKNDAQKLIKSVLSQLKVGEISGVLEWPTHFSIVQVLKKNQSNSQTQDGYQIQIAALPKADFATWRRKEIQSIAVECLEFAVCPHAGVLANSP